MSSDALTADNGAGIVVDPTGRPLEGVRFVTANEEHGFVSHGGNLAVGDVVRVVPNHACGTVNMWSRMLAVSQERAPVWWDIVGRH